MQYKFTPFPMNKNLINQLNTLLKTPLANRLFKYLSNVLTYGSFLIPVIYLVVWTSHGNEYRGYGVIAFFFLILIMIIRPLADLFPNIVLFKKLLTIRRGMGIAMGMSWLTHGLGFFYQYPSEIGQSYIWSPTGMLVYGLIALFFTILLLLTSNNISVRVMGKKWKWLHKTVIILFYATCIHVALIGRREAIFQLWGLSIHDIWPLILGLGVFLLRLLAFLKTRKKMLLSRLIHK